MKRRVVVTGMGAVTPIGNDLDTFWKNIKAEKVAFKPITKFDTSDYKVKLAAEVEDFEPKEYMDAKTAKRMEPFSQYAVVAAIQALEDSKLNLDKEDRTRVGVSVGSGIGSLETLEREHTKILNKGDRKSVV